MDFLRKVSVVFLNPPYRGTSLLTKTDKKKKVGWWVEVGLGFSKCT
jgi:hypothetical protein